jgi:hypothetical protein
MLRGVGLSRLHPLPAATLACAVGRRLLLDQGGHWRGGPLIEHMAVVSLIAVIAWFRLESQRGRSEMNYALSPSAAVRSLNRAVATIG